MEWLSHACTVLWVCKRANGVVGIQAFTWHCDHEALKACRPEQECGHFRTVGNDNFCLVMHKDDERGGACSQSWKQPG